MSKALMHSEGAPQKLFLLFKRVLLQGVGLLHVSVQERGSQPLSLSLKCTESRVNPASVSSPAHTIVVKAGVNDLLLC